MDRFDFFQQLSRRYPGSITFTSAYLTPLPLDRYSRVAEVGCGNGHRVSWVSRSRCCELIAIDKESRHLERTYQRAEEGGSSGLVQLRQVENYSSLPLEEQSVDLIIAEEASFEIDFIEALKRWRKYVRPGGHITVTPMGVVNRHPPNEVTDRWQKLRGSALESLEDYHQQLSGLGLKLVHQVQLPAHEWEEHYMELDRYAKGLVTSGKAEDTDSTILEVYDEVAWFRRFGRGRVFLQAFVLEV